jgi:DNA-binding MarR family transcriptional regulator
MDVKTAVPEDDGRSASDDSAETACPSVTATADLAELLHLMPRVIRGLKRGGDHGGSARSGGSPFAAMFKGGELGPRHIPVLVVLVLDGPLGVGGLAHRLGLNVATVSLMVGELARAGLVERTEDEQDRRRTLVSISERHRRRLGPFVEHRIAPARRALERMSPEVRQAFLAGLRMLADEIDRAPDEIDRAP